MRIAIVDYGAGNVRSLQYALERLGYSGVATSEPKELARADRVILPGVGNAGSAMKQIEARGLRDALASLQAPFLGICLGMQLLCKRSEEGNTECLGVIEASVSLLVGPRKVPHMGWSSVRVTRPDDPLLQGVEGDFFYFVHSYAVPADPSTSGETVYDGVSFSAAVSRGNYFGVQFHPERSGDAGHAVLRNFLTL